MRSISDCCQIGWAGLQRKSLEFIDFLISILSFDLADKGRRWAIGDRQKMKSKKREMREKKGILSEILISASILIKEEGYDLFRPMNRFYGRFPAKTRFKGQGKAKCKEECIGGNLYVSFHQAVKHKCKNTYKAAKANISLGPGR